MKLFTALHTRPVAVLTTAFLLSGLRAHCADVVDKRQFHLFKPTPVQHLREMSTDRPDKTESPYTVDAGWFQFEMDLVSYSRDSERSGGVKTVVDAWAVAPINLKVGLTHRMDLQLVLDTYNHVRVRAGGVSETLRGYGDTTLRLKYNFWGNDSGDTAFAAMPYVKFPTSQDELGNHHLEGGLILPLAVALPADFNLGLMTVVSALRDSDDRGYHAEFENSITVGRQIAGPLSGYVEFYSSVGTERGSDWIGTVNLGLTYGLTDNIQFDAGINFGVTKSAPDYNPFLGLSWRF